MKTDTRAVGVAYYTALGEKNIDKVKGYLHPDIQFTDPQETVIGSKHYQELLTKEVLACLLHCSIIPIN